MIRGNHAFPFGFGGNKAGICKALGFANYLEQSAGFITDNDNQRAYVDTLGNYNIIVDSENNSISEITCFNGGYSSVVQDVNGKYYFQRIRQ